MLQEIKVAGNRGTCGGVNMAAEVIETVLTLVDRKAPVYALWDVIHNRPAMDHWRARGLVTDPDPPRDAVVIQPAHGGGPTLRQRAQEKQWLFIPADCQLVSRVHNLALKAQRDHQHVTYIGVTGHPETEGVLDELKPENRTLIDARKIKALPLPERGAYLKEHIRARGFRGDREVVYSQTTLSPGDLRFIDQWLKIHYPKINIPDRWDICYAMGNRWAAVDQLIDSGIDMLLVVGSKHSHNSQELRLRGEEREVPSYSVDYPDELETTWFDNAKVMGTTSGASVFEPDLWKVIDAVKTGYLNVRVNELPQVVPEEQMTFRLPRAQMEALFLRYG